MEVCAHTGHMKQNLRMIVQFCLDVKVQEARGTLEWLMAEDYA